MESEVQQDRQRTYDVTLRYVRITIVTVETTMRFVCVVVQHVIVNSIKIMSVVQKRFYEELMSPATMKRT
jgi:hypothetical protein